MIRKLILAGAALVALSAGAQAGNTSLTVQSGPLNISHVTQANTFGSNTAALAQFGGQVANVSTVHQSTIIGNNTQASFQDSEAFPGANNFSLVTQSTFLGKNSTTQIQVP